MATRRTMIAVVGALAALSACTQVLGLERAKEEDGTPTKSMGSAPRSVPVPGTACEEAPLPKCTSCLESCGGAIDVDNESARVDLDRYAMCLGARCGADQETCARQIEDPGLFSCLGECAADCAMTQLVAPCELYCACMDQFCPGESDFVGDCMTVCAALPADIRDCRRDHCEWGRGAVDHCQHASDRVSKCESVGEGFQPCGAGKELSWACTSNSECCSGNCGDGACSL